MRSPGWDIPRIRNGCRSRVPRAEGSATDLGKVSPVVICDLDRDRSAALANALAPELPVLRESSVEGLMRTCREQSPIVAALALDEPHSVTGLNGGAANAALWQFIREYSSRLAIVGYTDTSRLQISEYCRPLAAGVRQVLNAHAPMFVEELRDTLVRLAHDHEAHARELHRLCGYFAPYGLYGRSQALQQVFRRAYKASCFSDMPVLILGETGTGKQLLAEAIHGLDLRRCQRPFLTINCIALTKTLAESELFGHTRGAFSGAQGERLGLFRAANGGTILLDEIGELDLELQPKLLRVLQDRRLLPVGEDYEHPVDVRIIAATNRPLRAMIQAGRFREDLFQRLNVFQIEVPPLRERPEDIAVQTRHLLEDLQPDRAERVLGLGPRMLEVLQQLPWEGNSRQLANLLREALAEKEKGATLNMEDLPAWVLETVAHAPQGARSAAAPADTPMLGDSRMSLSQAVEDYERRLLQLALEQNRGNRTRTAAMLGLTPRSIHNKIKKYQLS